MTHLCLVYLLLIGLLMLDGGSYYVIFQMYSTLTKLPPRQGFCLDMDALTPTAILIHIMAQDPMR